MQATHGREPGACPLDVRRWKALALAWTAQAVGAAVFLGVPALGAQLAAAYALGLRELGVALAGLTFGAGLSVIAWGRLVDRIGEMRVMVAGSVIAAVNLALLIAVPSGLGAALLLALAGAGSASASAAGGRSVLHWFGTRERGLAMGIRHTAQPVGGAAGALVLTALAGAYSVRGALAALAVVCALTAAAVHLLASRPRASEPTPPGGAGVLGDARVRRIVTVSVLLAIPQLSLSLFLVVFLSDDRGWSAGHAVALLAAIQLAGAAARPLVGRLSDLHGRRLGFLARLAACEVVALLALAAAAPQTGGVLVAAVLAAGIGTLLWNVVAAVAAAELAPPGRAGAVIGWQTSAVFLGGAASAPGVAALAAAASWRAVFVMLAVPAAAAAILLLRADRQPAAPSIEALLTQALSGMSSAVALIEIHTPAQGLVYVNTAFERLTGYHAAEVLGQPWTLLEGPETAPSIAAEQRAALLRGQELRVRVRHHRKDGSAFWNEMFVSPLADGSGHVTHFLAVQKDVTAHAEAQHRAAHLAYHDALTGLPNRTQIQEHLALALARARRAGGALGVLFLDLDGFKPVNDRYGHDTGDRLLQAVAERWRAVARGGDLLARYGGDEFVLLLADLDPEDARAAADAAAERLATLARQPFTLASSPEAITLEVSVGIAVFPHDADSSSELLVAADAAMYEVKRTTRAARVTSRSSPR